MRKTDSSSFPQAQWVRWEFVELIRSQFMELNLILVVDIGCVLGVWLFVVYGCSWCRCSELIRGVPVTGLLWWFGLGVFLLVVYRALESIASKLPKSEGWNFMRLFFSYCEFSLLALMLSCGSVHAAGCVCAILSINGVGGKA